VRGVIQVMARVVAELATAQAEVAAMPAGKAGGMLGTCAQKIAGRDRLIAANARREGDEDAQADAAPKPMTQASACPNSPGGQSARPAKP